MADTTLCKVKQINNNNTYMPIVLAFWRRNNLANSVLSNNNK